RGHVGVEQPKQVRVLDRQAGAGLALEEFCGGGVVLPVAVEQLDGAGGVRGAVAGGVDGREEATTQAGEQLVAGDAGQWLHGASCRDRDGRSARADLGLSNSIGRTEGKGARKVVRAASVSERSRPPPLADAR